MAKLVIEDAPDNMNWGRPQDFLDYLKEKGSAVVPKEKNWEFVVIGPQIPSSDDSNKLWIKIDSNRNLEGFFLYTKNKWRPAYNYAPKEVIWMYGLSSDLPEGFRLLDGGIAGAPNLSDQFIGPVGAYTYFACVFLGY